MKQALLQPGKIAVPGIMMTAQISQHGRAVGASVGVAGPRVNGDAAGRDAQMLHGLTESAVRHAFASPQFHNAGGPQDAHQVHAEGHVQAPG